VSVLALPSDWLATASALGFGLLSALVPVVNAELWVAGAAALLPKSRYPAMLALFTMGTMLGKGLVFMGAEKLAARATPKVRERIERVSSLLHRRPAMAWPVVFLSAVVGVPPYYPITIAAGIVRMGLATFFVVGFVGRLARFAAIAYGVSAWPWGRGA
jgi:membrane protein YqaA with SNARE-associated domain